MTRFFIAALAFVAVATVVIIYGPTYAHKPESTNPTKQVRQVRDFTGIGSTISGDVHVTQGKDFSVTVSAPADKIDKITTTVKNGVLHVDCEKCGYDWSGSDKNPVIVDVTMPVIESVAMTGSGDLLAQNNWQTDGLDISLAGSGDVVFMQIVSRKMSISLAGSGSVRAASGNSEKVTCSIAGSGEIELEQLTISMGEASIAGSGDVTFGMVTKSLEASIMGSGDIRYHGTPSITRNIMGSGDIQQIK